MKTTMPEYCERCGCVSPWAKIHVGAPDRPDIAWAPNVSGLVECGQCHDFYRWLGPGELTPPSPHDLPQHILDTVDEIIPEKRMNKDQQIAELRKGLDPSVIKKRQQFSYIEGFFVISELNRIFGHSGWDHHVEQIQVKDFERTKDGKTGTAASAVATVRLDVRFADGSSVVRSGVGAGDGINYSGDVAAAREFASKEAETDALKRAARTLGPPFGLSLYDSDNPVHKGGVDIWEDDGPIQRQPPSPEAQGTAPAQQAPPAQVTPLQNLIAGCNKILGFNPANKPRIDAILAKYGDGTPAGVRREEMKACLGEMGRLYLEVAPKSQAAA